jgi:hypothetical protein
VLDTISAMRIRVDFWTRDGASLCVAVVTNIHMTWIAEHHTIQSAPHPLICVMTLWARLVRHDMVGFFPLLIERVSAVCAKLHLA